MAPARTWDRRQAILAVVLVFASGAGTILYSPYDVTQPDSLIAFAPLTVVVVIALWVTCLSAGRLRLPDWAATFVLVAVSMFFTAWYAHWQPVLGLTSDNAEALAVGVNQLREWHSPWGARTSLDNVPSPMLGGFILAAPFVAFPLGLFAQQLVWFAAFVAFLVRTAGLHAAAMVTTLVMLSPLTRLTVPAGSDNWIVALVVLFAGTWGYSVVRGGGSHWQWWLSSLAFGVSMSYRFTVWIAVIPLLFLFWREFGHRAAIRWFLPAGVVTAVLVLGPLLISREAYMSGPVAMAMEKAQEETMAHTGVIAAVATLGVICVLSWRVRDLVDAWMALAVGLATLSAVIVLAKVPVVGWERAVGSYEGVAYNGAWLVFGLCALAMRRTSSPRQATPLER